jgi:hypothetical protein
MLAHRKQDEPFWSRLAAFDPGGLAPGARTWAGERWARAAQMEHASIASFSRFSLQLVAVAAPPALIAGAHEAAIDEVHHARISFALASRFLGRQLGPGPLPLAGDLLGTTSLEVVAAETFRDGCLNETLSAAEASAAAAAAGHEAIRHAMLVLARDEQRHAELAWEVVGWAVAVGGSPVREAIAAQWKQRPVIPRNAASPGTDFVPGLGHLDEAELARVRSSAIAEQVTPAVVELLGG